MSHLPPSPRNAKAPGVQAGGFQKSTVKTLSKSDFTEAPFTAQQQRDLFPQPRKPRMVMPDRGSRAWLALTDMLEGPITQIDWLQTPGRGWRLAAAIKELSDLNWPLVREWVKPEFYANPIKRYSLPANARRRASAALKWGQA